MEGLPAELTIDILSRLPVKTIVHCKRVCKKWRNLVLDSSFVNLHLSRSPTSLIVQQNGKYQGSIDPGILKWVEIEDKDDHHHLHHDSPMNLDFNMVPNFQNSLIYKLGSVNGLICLWQNCPKHDNTLICNPVTREIVTISNPQYYEQDCRMVANGFGVCSSTGEYKVVRTFQRKTSMNSIKSHWLIELEAEVYTLGTGQWRSLGRVPYWFDGSDFGALLNDHCHWIVCDMDAPEKICTFDLNKETFQLFPAFPSEAIEESDIHSQSLAVLNSCLCMSDAYRSHFTVWVMKEYGVKKSWHKEVVITEAISRGVEWNENISLIEGLKDGTILFLSGSLWELYPRSDTIEETDLFDGDWLMRGLVYRPSFLKLRNFESERVRMF